jgi:hypothetical protein
MTARGGNGIPLPAEDGQGNLLRNIVLFGRLLRALGIGVMPTQVADLIDGLRHVDMRRRDDVKAAARAVLINRREHLAVFDLAFDLFWQARDEGEAWRPEADGLLVKTVRFDQVKLAAAARSENDRLPAREREDPVIETIYTYSPQEVLRGKDFAQLTPEELEEVRRLLHEMAWNLNQRRTRRKTRAPRGAYLDMRRTFRHSLRFGGEPLQLAWQRRKLKRRPLVVICDISGSMERYSRVLLQFLYVLSSHMDKAEAFVFSTRLTRITRQLKERDVDAALDQVGRAVRDWSGGTRIGEVIKTFNYRWGRRVLGQGAIVLIISDGWDRGDVELLEREMSRLRLSCQRLIWLNPLLGSPDYEPLTRGIQAALPYVDDFMPVHNLDSLEQLGRLLEQLGERRPSRR